MNVDSSPCFLYFLEKIYMIEVVSHRLDTFIQNEIEVLLINKQKIYEQLMMKRVNLYHPFPFEEIRKINNLFIQFHQLDNLSPDLNTYWMNIAGSLSYVSKGCSHKIPLTQMNLLKTTFYQQYPAYEFLEELIEDYPFLLAEYKRYEEVRVLLIAYLKE